jgi:hypothetical protein
LGIREGFMDGVEYITPEVAQESLKAGFEKGF